MDQNNMTAVEYTDSERDTVTATQEPSPMPAGTDGAGEAFIPTEDRSVRLKAFLKKAGLFTLTAAYWIGRISWYLVKGFFKLLWGSFKLFTCFRLARLK